MIKANTVKGIIFLFGFVSMIVGILGMGLGFIVLDNSETTYLGEVLVILVLSIPGLLYFVCYQCFCKIIDKNKEP